MKYFYKIEYGKLLRGSGYRVPDGMIMYDKGNEPEEMVEILSREQKEKEEKERMEKYDKAIQNMLDKKAQEYRYDNMMSARSYAGWDNPFREEAERLATWCANCWKKAGEVEKDVLEGKREMPSVEELIAELPGYEE